MLERTDVGKEHDEPASEPRPRKRAIVGGVELELEAMDPICGDLTPEGEIATRGDHEHGYGGAQ